MTEMLLCQEKNDRGEVNVWAEIIDDCLKISGQDFGATCQETFGDDEYEYFYLFSRSDTEKLQGLICKGENTLLQALKEKFGGMSGCRDLRDFCENNNILYKFFTC